MDRPLPPNGATDPASLVERLVELYPDAAADPSQIRLVRAPGRVNLIGEHTDYNDGRVLPAAISLAIDLAFVATDDRLVDVSLAATGERARLELANLGPRRGTWPDYAAGTAWALAEAGAPVHGFRGLLASTLPPGAGLSSSAALELAFAWALSAGEPPGLKPMALARTAQRAENEYVGVMCGLMDQFAVTMGRAGHAVHLDCRSLAWRAVPLPDELELVICHSGSPRRLEASAYNTRRAECSRAVDAIAAHESGIAALRDVDIEMLERHRDDLDELAFARAMHVVTENARVAATEAALRSGDLDDLGRIFAASHASLRDRFEVSSDALDTLVDIAVATPGVVAARLTGAGFGGCTVNLVRRGEGGALRAAVEGTYAARTGLTPQVFSVEAADGAAFVAPFGV
jgi:galactokinase